MPKSNAARGRKAKGVSAASDPVLSMAVLTDLLNLANKVMAPFSTYLEKQYAISINEFRILMLIGQFPSSASHDLAAMTGVTTMSISRAVAALQKHGRIEVERDATNGRRKILALTPEGQRLFEVMKPHAEAVASYLLSNFEESEGRRFHTDIARMAATLEAVDETGGSLFMKQTRPSSPDA